jgi:hypothetical protein
MARSATRRTARSPTSSSAPSPRRRPQKAAEDAARATWSSATRPAADLQRLQDKVGDGAETEAKVADLVEQLNAANQTIADQNGIPLRFVDPALIGETTVQGQPLAWTIDGAYLGFECLLDQAYAITLRCLEKFALSDAVPTNALLTDYPDAYLFAAMAEAGPFLRDAELAQAYEAKLERAIGEINAKDARSRAQQRLSTEPGQLQRMGRSSGYSIYRDR